MAAGDRELLRGTGGSWGCARCGGEPRSVGPLTSGGGRPGCVFREFHLPEVGVECLPGLGTVLGAGALGGEESCPPRGSVLAGGGRRVHPHIPRELKQGG